MTPLQIQLDDKLLALWQKLKNKYSQKSENQIFYELVVSKLSDDEDWEKWDQQIIADSKNPISGLNKLMQQARAEYKSGNFTEL